jgi:MFS family permease
MCTGIIIGYLCLALFGDCFGRKTFIVTGLGLAALGWLLTVLASNMYLAAAGMLVALAGLQFQYSVNMNMLSEVVG